MKNNLIQDKFYWAYLTGFFLILALPVFVLPPWFSPVDWGKTIVFRSILAVLLFLFAWQLLYKRNEIAFSNIKKNKIVWVLALFFVVIFLATLFSQDINFSLWGSPYRAQGAINFFFYIIFPLLVFLILKPSDWNKILNFSIFIGILVCIIATIQVYGLVNNIFLSSPDRPPSTMGNPIMLAIYLLLLFFITLSFAIGEKKIHYRLMYIGSLLLFFLVILTTGTRAAYLGLTLGIIYFFLFLPSRIKPSETGVDSKTGLSAKKIGAKKFLIYKILLVIVLLFGIFAIYYVNSQKSFPQFLEKNKIFQAVKVRLSLDTALQDPRFSAWQVAIKAIKEKPIWGWGPENLAIGFDQYYHPSLPYISKFEGSWYDRAHNIILDTMVTMGGPTAIIYLALFIVLFWQLQKLKTNQERLAKINENPIICHGIQATLIAYFTANLFAFDGFSSYLLFFLIIGYCLHLTDSKDKEINKSLKQMRAKNIIAGVLFIFLFFFLWQYNLMPLKINAQINRFDNFAENKKCDKSFLVADKILAKRSFLDPYMAMHYIEISKKCAGIDLNKDSERVKTGIELMQRAVKIRPRYSRLWIYLGSFKTIAANTEKDMAKKEDLLKEANTYFEKASQLAPNHQEVLVEWAKMDMIAGNYEVMKEKSEKCITLDPTLNDCYWIRALSKIYLKDFIGAKEDIKIVFKEGFGSHATFPLHQLAVAYAAVENHKELAAVYEKLIQMTSNVPEYHSSLAFAYSKMGEYSKARQEALIFLELMPEAKEEVDLFLKTLPY